MHEPLRLIQVTDSHLGHESGPVRAGYPDSDLALRHVLETARAREGLPDRLLLTGDLAENPSPGTYTRLKALLDATGPWPTSAMAGNHDDARDLAVTLESAGHAVHRAERLGSWQLIGLDSSQPGSAAGHLSDAELQRLEGALTAHPERPALIALHHPVVATGSPWMDAMGLTNADALFAVLDRHPQVRACVFGHAHQVIDTFHGDVRLLGCPATCVQFRPGATEYQLDEDPDTGRPGYRVLELYPDSRLETRVERLPAPAAPMA